MKKQSFITILLSVLMSMTGANAFAHDIEAVNEGVTIYYVWANNNTELAVSYCGSSYSSYSNEYAGNVVIPESVDYNGNTYPVTSIGDRAFYGCSGLTSVTIPNSVTSIGNYAFSDCSGLTTIVSEIKTPFKIGSIASTSVPLIVPTGTKTAYQSTAGWISFTNIYEAGEGGSVGCKYYIDGLFYTIGENNTTSLTSANKSISGAIIIPDQVEYNGKKYDVTSIGYEAFYNCSSLTSVTIPNGVTAIGYAAFADCSGLTSVTIPNSVIAIDYAAFADCSGLTSVTIPNSVTSIGENAFSNCFGLTTIISEIKTPFEIDYIAYTSIPLIVPTGTKAAYQSTAGWRYFTNIDEVGEGGSVGCKYDIDGFIYTIGENNTASLTSANKSISGAFIIPDQVEYNGKKYNVTSIGNKAFNSCSGLTSVTIPNSVTSIGDNVFYGCTGLTSVTIGNSVTSIGDYAFSGCSGLTSVTIPNSVTSIGEYAFRSCSSLVSVIIGSGVLSIKSNAFYNTNIKKTIWLTNTPPTGYKNAIGTANYVSNDQFGISNQVVYKYLSSNFVVDGIRYVPVSPSDRTCDAIDCTYDASVENINIGETVTNKNVTLTVMKVNPYTCYGNKYIKDLKLGLSGEIGDYAFYGCGNMETAELGQNIPSIGDYAFSSCSKLKSIVIPDAVTSLGSNAFSNCSAMTSSKIGNGVATINGYTFDGCSSLPDITIPQTVTTIGNNVFDNCTSLAKVILADSEATLTLGYSDINNYSNNNPIFSSCPLDYVYIGRDISYQTLSKYGYSPFYRNTSLRAVKITDKETEISENEFYGCTNLQQVEIGDGVTTIDNWAFSGCSSLKYFAFGTQLASIGQEAFSDCTAIEEIISKAQTPPVCGPQALEDINIWECKLYVPDGCMAVYGDADQWMNFFYKEEGEGTLPQGGDNPDDSKKCETPTITVDGSSVKFDCKTSGVIFHYTITSSDAKSDITNGDIVVKNSYTISVYATKEGYTDSEVAKKSFQVAGSGKRGDVNGDNKVDAADHVELTKIIMATE